MSMSRFNSKPICQGITARNTQCKKAPYYDSPYCYKCLMKKKNSEEKEAKNWEKNKMSEFLGEAKESIKNFTHTYSNVFDKIKEDSRMLLDNVNEIVVETFAQLKNENNITIEAFRLKFSEIACAIIGEKTIIYIQEKDREMKEEFNAEYFNRQQSASHQQIRQNHNISDSLSNLNLQP